MKAFLKNHRQAPRKMRLVADWIRGKRVSEVLSELPFMEKKAAEPLRKLIASAVANARQENPTISEHDLIIKTITVDKGMTFFRYMLRARGRATPINKETSHVKVELTVAPKKGVQQSPAAAEQSAQA